MTAFDSTDGSELGQERLKELASIARLISYARQSAKSLNATVPVWYLDMALDAVLQEIYQAGDEHQNLVELDEDAVTPIQCH